MRVILKLKIIVGWGREITGNLTYIEFHMKEMFDNLLLFALHIAVC